MVSVLPSLDLSLIYLHDQYIYIFNTFRLNPCKTIPVFHSLARGDATAASATRCQARVRQNLSDRKLLRPKSILDRKLLRPKSILDRRGNHWICSRLWYLWYSGTVAWVFIHRGCLSRLHIATSGGFSCCFFFSYF